MESPVVEAVDVVTKDGPGNDRAHPQVGTCISLVAYVCASGPTLVVAAITLHRGWLPTSDDAVFSWRAWNVISRNPTLLGGPTHGYGTSGHAAFAIGPVLSWIMAVPVHANPSHGALVISAVLAAVAEGLIVTAARSWKGNGAGLAAAAGIVALCWAEPQLLFNPIWTPWIGLLWFSAAIVCALPLMSGRLAWAPVEIVAVSIAAQAHVIFAPVAVLVGALALFVGVTSAKTQAGRFGRRGRWWLGGAGVLGLMLWVPTLIAEASSNPGNVELILRSQRGGSSLGVSYAIHGAASSVAIVPSWLRTLPQAGSDGFYQALDQLYGASTTWWFTCVVLLVAAICWGVWRHNAALIKLGVLTLVTNITAVATVARIPGADALEMVYLSVIFFPIGILVWSCIGMFGWDVVAALSKIGVFSSSGLRYAGGAARLLGAVALVAATIYLVVVTADKIPSQESVLGGPTAELMTKRVVSFVRENVRKGTPFRLQVDSPQPLNANAVQMGAAYQLYVDGWKVRFPGELGDQIGAGVVTGSPTATIRCDAERQTCHVEK